MGNIASIGTGSSNGNEAADDGEFPFYIRSNEVKRMNKWEFDEEAIIIPGEGGIGDIYHYINGKFALHQRVYRIHFNTDIVNTKFVYYYMTSNFKYFIQQKAVSATVKSIRKPMLEKFIINLPSLENQQKIVNILGRFDSLCNDIQKGLPAEIEARQKAYEFYRDELLRF